MLTITNRTLQRTLAAAATYIERGATVTSCTSPRKGVWIIHLTWSH